MGLRPTKIDLSDTVERVLWTFAEAFMGTITFEVLIADANALRAAGIAGFAAVWTVLKELPGKRLKELEEEDDG